MKNINKLLKSLTVLIILLLPSLLYAAAMNNYCITPPFVIAGVNPNLLLMLDNSASQYDLEYQDTGHTYCANDLTTSCTPGTTCGGNAYCLESVNTTTTTTYSAKACTSDSQCPNSPTVYKAKSCTNNSQCTANGSKCSAGLCTKCNTSTGVGDCVVATHPCNAGFCTNCNTTTGSGDCTSTTNTTYNPVPCSVDSTCSAKTAGDTCNNKCNASRQCYDSTYSTSQTYVGYFATVDSSNNPVYYSYDLTNNIFTSGATMPGTCTYSAGTPTYVCVNTAGTPELLTGFVASGNFLNWLTASKFDVQKQILTGGKFDTTNNVLIAESRGCAGRKFLKTISGVNLTFAIRGGTPGGIGSTQSLATEYGQTYIELYTGTYNTSDCLSAMYDWMNYDSVNLGSFQNDTKGCVGAGNGQYNAVNVWNHILHDCYDGLNNKAQGYSTNLNPLEIECQKAYAAGVAPNTITDPNSGIAVCSSVLSYVDANGNAQTGYLGACWNGSSFSNPCDLTQMQNYCVVNVNTNPVIDPSSTVLPGSGSSAPGFIMEQGLMNTSLVGTLTVQVDMTTAPTGLLYKYKDLIRFGAMTFNNNGSASETGTGKLPVPKACSTTQTRTCFMDSDCPSGESCTALTNKDSGQILSYIGAGQCSVSGTPCKVDGDCVGGAGDTCQPSVGDHTTGLINLIDSRVASTWTPFAEAFYDAIGYYTQNKTVRLNSSDFVTNEENASFPNPVQYKCQKNNVLLVTDGMSTADQNATMLSFVSSNNNGGNYTSSASPTILTPPSYFGSVNVDQLSWYGCKFNNGCTATLTNNGVSWSDKIINPVITHVVYSGTACQFKDNAGNCCATSSLSGGKCVTYADEKSVPERLMQLTAQNGGGTYTLAQNPQALYNALDAAFQTIAASSSSGTAASVLASGEGSGANLIQALFYPIHAVNGAQITWTGSLQNFWYYIDPLLGNSSIREDSTNDFTLNLTQDYIMHFRFPRSVTDQNTVADLYADADGDGIADSSTPTSTKYLDEYIDPSNKLKYLWEAGKLLWSRPPLTRNIYTFDGTNMITIPQTTSPVSAASTLLNLLNVGGDVNKANAVVRYVRGEDTPFNPPITGFTPTYRNRTVTINSDTHPWKLGDIVTSTPKIGSWIPLDSYHKTYGDTTYGPLGYDPQLTDAVDSTKFITTSGYKDRGMVFVGANDGTLHAFKLGTIELLNGKYDKAQLCDSRTSCSTTTLGNEIWAYIPKHVLPYLQYMTDPNYCHLYYVDLVPTIVDASIGANDTGNPTDVKDVNSWRTILIGGTRYGGACNDSSTSYDVQTPSSGKGYSSYFALDVTDTLANPDNPTGNPPKVLWEFSNETIASYFPGDLTAGPNWVGGLGFATSGPAIVRVGAAKDSSGHPLNGRWFAVFGSGPTGPIDSTTHQFKGYSDQPLKVYIMDLRGPSYGFWRLKTGISNAFAGSLVGSPIDLDQNNPAATGYYQDDALYFGYTKAESNPITSGTRWTRGGVLRIATKESIDPSQWSLSTVMDNTGPITAAVAKLQNYKAGSEALWLYFGTGRYFYKIGSQIDDATSSRAIRGVKDPCFNNDPSHYPLKLNPNCTTTVSDNSLGDVTYDSTNATSAGWRIGLDSCTDASGNIVSCSASNAVYDAERMVTDPLATPIGAVFFTTIEPSADVCQFGGATHLWAVQYSTGGAVKQGVLRGEALIQVSTGAISEQNLSSVFTQKQDQGAAPGTVEYRRTAGTQGLASSEKPQIAVPPKPINKILHMRER